MDWRLPRTLGLALFLGLGLGASSGCSSGSGSSGSSLSIESCSLGCSGAQTPGGQISCGVTDVFVNQEIRVTFTSAIDLGSVNNNTFQVVESGSGKTPPGTFVLDSTDPRVLIYKPQVAFDSSGNPIFGLTADQTYILRIPGRDLDPLGPYIQNTSGQPNRSRLQCTLVASRGIFDANPGAPQSDVFVDVLDPADPTGQTILEDVPAQLATGVWRNSDIRIVFDDVMNPATLANPVTGVSDFIKVRVDSDGDPSTTSDQVDLSGTFDLTLNQTAARTTLIFTPNGGLPSAGTAPRRIIVALSSLISDLGGNQLADAGEIIFTTETIEFDTLVLTEEFDVDADEDTLRTGNSWEAGLLGTGPGGGSGRLGDLVVPAGEVVVLSTDSEDFSSPVLQRPEVFDLRNVVDLGDPATFTIDGGVFEFATLRVDAGAVLRFEGSNPARLFVRGEMIVQGLLDVSGAVAPAHDSRELLGGLAGTPGPGGGAGGDGGLRPDGAPFNDVLDPDIPDDIEDNPAAAIADPADPASYIPLNGTDGVGVPFPNTLAVTPEFRGGGQGGLGWPQPTGANPGIRIPTDKTDVTAFVFESRLPCVIIAPGGAAGGGAHAFSGFVGDTQLINPAIFNDETHPAPPVGSRRRFR